jgi:hypothetical protein
MADEEVLGGLEVNSSWDVDGMQELVLPNRYVSDLIWSPQLLEHLCLYPGDQLLLLLLLLVKLWLDYQVLVTHAYRQYKTTIIIIGH